MINLATLPTVQLEQSNLHPGLQDDARELLPAIVLAYQDGRPAPERWFYIVRDGNVGTVSLADFPLLGQENSVSFCVNPAYKCGTDLSVRGADWNEGMPLRQAALIATGHAYGNNWATGGRDLPNHGLAALEWCANRLARVTL